MRLTCPNCRAQYEVADSAIPARGRDVQCSSCGHGWFQLPDAGRTAEAEARMAPRPEPETPRAAQRELDPAIADVLKAEAEREAQQRRRETADLVETQQELALDDPPAPAETPEAAEDSTAPAPARFAEAKRSEVPRRDLLPDIEEINSSLRAKTLTKAAAANRLTEAEVEAQKRSGRGFRLGFASVLLVALFAVLVYANAPGISARLPATTPYLEAYVGQMNAGRLWLNGKLMDAGAAIEGMLTGSEG
ncbi:zinc-ribbon domain-containing protein [Dinoroseobacter sp. PD6]|uniref:zinc-ribbon domain-containing protein n=1 Tax=Dinoroseobacter sp. PD6 TaxID=3028384 RepID=UPI00237B97B9|nr:zinc-ribbon domain-containing protein [Dinoroseobacter sp. PD6]MDD9716768.1 zinc-ribbon domain-containing protein [Dinoroseobacter sp. PD6]